MVRTAESAEERILCPNAQGGIPLEFVIPIGGTVLARSVRVLSPVCFVSEDGSVDNSTESYVEDGSYVGPLITVTETMMPICAELIIAMEQVFVVRVVEDISRCCVHD